VGFAKNTRTEHVGCVLWVMAVFPMQDVRSNGFYCAALDALGDASIEFLVGGAFALRTYTDIERNTRDLDLMIRPRDVDRVLALFCDQGFHADYAFSHWLAKVYWGEYLIDIIFRAGNGLCEVDDAWFANARETEMFDRKVRICPPEEIIWQKAYIMERERFDGADVLHLLRSCAQEMDWQRLLARFGDDWRVLLSHLVLFGFVYPGDRDLIPEEIARSLLDRAMTDRSEPQKESPICQGTLLSRAQYLVDVERWGFVDARINGRASMTQRQLVEWTNAIARESR
jgi:hypothetical protein